MIHVESEEIERIRQFADQWATQQVHHRDVRLDFLAKEVGQSVKWLQHYVFIPPQWTLLRDVWAKRRLLQAMDTVYASVQTREAFSVERIRKQAGIDKTTFHRLGETEWQQRLKTLPTTRERVTTLVWQLVESNIPLEQFTKRRVYSLVGIHGSVGQRQWFAELYRCAYFQLQQRQYLQVSSSLEGHCTRLIAGIWVDLDADFWDLRGASLRILKREKLRSDIAAIAWPLLQEELSVGELSPATVAVHYEGFRYAGQLLGEEISHINHITLEGIQRAWASSASTLVQRRRARRGLQCLCEKRLAMLKEGQETEQRELLRTVGWLRDLVSLPHDEPASAFLSEEELNTVLSGCVADIREGQAFMRAGFDLLTKSSRRCPTGGKNAHLVVCWAVALMILIMTCTGLRRQSILSLEIEDWMELRPGLFGIIWRHGKKGEENLAVLSSLVAQLLQQYVEATTPLRAALQTKRVFLSGNVRGLWQPMKQASFSQLLDAFAVQHRIERNGELLRLGSTVFRRTFTTRALYEGSSVEALRSQLGHTTILSTLRYGKLDLFEHAAQVRPSLDLYGRHALTLWKKPLLLDTLEPAERGRLLQDRAVHDQQVGLCRHDACVQLDLGGPPPCSLCEHLVTGKEFLPAWHQELQTREQFLAQVKDAPGGEVPGGEVMYTQLKGQLHQFQQNLTSLVKSCEAKGG